ncbi:hypothetical protein JCM15457_2494 [Liquorilactobacillus sucicola DSM 21376 = JCM 15457]|uniref:Gram-positive cocci surface proteins LPxTG domain-containing protein n=1 Tax=Liquorilactobacillus sucicola DSM 21376 = JCM 15457 TaxID=1423806 RepID=A0A023D033_9LACO|nr:hypothetical protein FD15_GL002298 [Liquorilactobacillus sucicola DSM 21376 = JCM 15457]GAJ27492.1 hypothetical protein JCM15457_2494 [Liquorilactobacillus sucicola DSM 21376 = JCM 15457]
MQQSYKTAKINNGTTDEKKESKKADSLPQTGDESDQSLSIWGTILVALSGLLGIAYKNKKKGDRN